MEQLDSAGIVGPHVGSKARQVLIHDVVLLDQYLQSSSPKNSTDPIQKAIIEDYEDEEELLTGKESYDGIMKKAQEKSEYYKKKPLTYSPISAETLNWEELFKEAARFIVTNSATVLLLQKKLKLGYNDGSQLMDQLEAAGIVGTNAGIKAREVLITDILLLEQYLQSSSPKKRLHFNRAIEPYCHKIVLRKRMKNGIPGYINPYGIKRIQFFS